MLFLCSVDVLNRHQICLYIVAALFIVTPGRKLRFDVSFVLLMLFSLSMLLFNDSFQSSITNMLKVFNYPLCYLLGTSTFVMGTRSDLQGAERDIRTVIYVIATGTFVHYFLNMLVNLGRTNREVIEFWSGKELSATGQATFACLIIGVIAATLFSRTSKKKKLLAGIALFVVILYNLILAGRTLFGLVIIALLAAFFYKSHVNKTNIVKVLVTLFLISTVLAVLYSANIFNIKAMYEDSNFYDRFFEGEYIQELDDDKRGEHKLYYLTHLGDSMFGGGHLRQAYGHSAHDLYLDTYDESGVFAALFIVFYVLASLGRMIRSLMDKRITLETRQLVLGVYLIANTMFFMEPIIRGSSWLLFSYCLIDGAVSHMLNISRRSLMSVI